MHVLIFKIGNAPVVSQISITDTMLFAWGGLFIFIRKNRGGTMPNKNGRGGTTRRVNRGLGYKSKGRVKPGRPKDKRLREDKSNKSA